MLNFLGGIKRRIGDRLADLMEWHMSRSLLPKQNFFLSGKHLKNCRFVRNRIDLLKLMPADAVVAEVGVFRGEYALQILNIATPRKLFLIDSWEGEFKVFKGEVESRFKDDIHIGKVEIIQDNSLEAIERLKDHSLDWVYLDSDHSYQYTLQELKLLSKKVKKDGIICGDDYTLGVWFSWNSFGVIEAVNEFCVRYDFEMIYFALAPGMFNSFALRKIRD